MSDLRIATRRSPLALAQARQVATLLASAHPGMEVSLIEVTTSGDRDRTTSVTTLTEVGAFVRAVQQAVLDQSADVAVHSCKDLPVDGPVGLISFFPLRERPWDVLCGFGLDDLPRGARVGTGSPRRAAQMRRLRPDVEMVDIRGNVDTRIHAVSSGEYDAVILAEAGLRRLGREAEIRHRFSVDEMVPAPAQAALAVEVISDTPAAGLVAAIDDPRSRAAVETERGLLQLTKAGCRSALGALASVGEQGISVSGFVSDSEGSRSGSALGATPAETAQSLKEVLSL